MDNNELCLIDASIKSLRDVPLNPSLSSLNLHANNIRRIENLHILTRLTHLDLSSNKVTIIEGLDRLVSVRSVNLACNFIQVVDGLQKLRSLTRLNVSFNQINDLSGLSRLPSTCPLAHLELQGNRLDNLAHVVSQTENLRHLQSLTLNGSGGATNPVCQQAGYREVLLSALPRLQVLDGTDRLGRQGSSALDDTSDVPGLEKYLDFLVSTSDTEMDSTTVGVITPKIDAAYQAFKQRGGTAMSTDLSSSAAVGGTTSASDADTTKSPQRMAKGGIAKMSTSDHDTRLEKLENQLAQLLYGGSVEALRKDRSSDEKNMMSPTPTATPPKKHKAKRDIDETDESDDNDDEDDEEEDEDEGEQEQISQQRGRSSRGSRIPSYSSRGQGRGQGLRGRGQQEAKRSSHGGTQERSGQAQARASSVSRPSHSRKQSNIMTKTDPSPPRPTNSRDRADTYVSLMKELEKERERRWKAEQATKKLVDHIKELQKKASDEKDAGEIAVQSSTRLKQALTTERETKHRMQEQIDTLKEQVKASTEKVVILEKNEQELRATVRSVQDTSAQAEREMMQQRAHQAKKVQQYSMKASASQREVEILQTQTSTLRGQVQQMQELLANREQEHRKASEGCFAVGSPEFKSALDQEVRKVEMVTSQQINTQQKRIDEMQHKYEALEEEFRQALQIEARRYAEMRQTAETSSRKCAENQHTLLQAARQEEKSSEMIAELTAVVKEQKGRLAELSRGRQEHQAEYKERVSTLEAHLDEARRRMVNMEMLKKEKVKLEATVQSQASLLEGLKKERVLWSAELAEQGVALSQDRGRMQMKIEALTHEVNTLKANLERETDTVRIKSKVIDDQTKSIQDLKAKSQVLHEQITEKDQMMEDNLGSLQEQLKDEVEARQALEDEVKRLNGRKENLKDKVDELKDTLETERLKNEQLTEKYRGTSSLITRLEKDLHKTRDSFAEKERKLTLDKETAIKAAREAVDKLRSMDDSFRKQLDRKEEAHQRAMDSLATEKQQQIDAANQRMLQVEEEMRLMLREYTEKDKAKEEMLKRFTQGFSSLL